MCRHRCTTPSRPIVSRRVRRLAGLAACVIAVVAAAHLGVLAGPRPAAGAVDHGNGFAGIVDGFRSWYGSYRLGDHGEVWCVDHGIPAPDVVLGYEAIGLDDRAPDTRRAIAWAVGRHGPGADRVTAAALMLVLHDLMGAVYPSGPLSVDALTPERLSGFGGREADVVAAARRIKADAVTSAHLVGPMGLVVSRDEPAAGRTGELRAELRDARGAALDGIVVHPAVTGAELLDDVDRTTDGDGLASWRFLAGAGENRFELAATVPGAELVALRPTRGAGQRVVRPAAATVSAATAYDAPVPRRLIVHKRGEAEPHLPVTGARFAVAGHEVVVGRDGRTPPVEVLPGAHTVTEIEPPVGYVAAGPWTVVVHDADVVVEVTNAAVPGHLVVDKVDQAGRPLAGATFEVRGDRDHDPATFETAIHDWSGPLRPGRYEVREVEPPPHHRLDPTPRIVHVRGGDRTVVRWENSGLASIGFAKRPPLAGAVFAVWTGEAGDAVEVARCTTDIAGRCSLPDHVIEAGAPFCWSEVVAPPGWDLAAGACLATGAAGSRTVVEVDEPPLPPPVEEPPPAVVAVAPPPESTEVRAAPPVEAPPDASTTAPPAAPPDAGTPPPPPAPVVAAELPRTGAPLVRGVGFALVLAGAGLLLVAGVPDRRRRA